MKKLLVFIILLFVTGASAPVHAQGSSLLPAGQVIDSDYFQTGETVQIDGEVRGDAFLLGGVVTVNGKVDGDLFALGAKVNLNGEVGGSIRAVAADVSVNSAVSRNVLLVCANCNVTHQANIAGSLLVTGVNLEESAAKIGRGFRFFGSRLFLNSEINNEAFVVADREFLLGPKASISGNLKYTGSTEAVLESGATVAGRIAYEKTNKDETFPRFFGAKTVLSSYQRIKPVTDLLGFLVSALIGFIFLGLFPKGFEKVANAIENRPYASLGWGTVIALMIPLVAILFAITLVGIPVSLVLLLLGYLAWIAAQYVVAFFLGRKILLKRFGERRGWALFLGLFLIYILGQIPVIGPLGKIILVLFALGAIALSYKQPVIIEQKPLPFKYPKRGRRRSFAKR